MCYALIFIFPLFLYYFLFLVYVEMEDLVKTPFITWLPHDIFNKSTGAMRFFAKLVPKITICDSLNII